MVVATGVISAADMCTVHAVLGQPRPGAAVQLLGMFIAWILEDLTASPSGAGTTPGL